MLLSILLFRFKLTRKHENSDFKAINTSVTNILSYFMTALFVQMENDTRQAGYLSGAVNQDV